MIVNDEVHAILQTIKVCVSLGKKFLTNCQGSHQLVCLPLEQPNQLPADPHFSLHDDHIARRLPSDPTAGDTMMSPGADSTG